MQSFAKKNREVRLRFKLGCAIVQAVSRRLLNAEARVCFARRGGQSGTATGFAPSPSFSPANIVPPLLHIQSSSGGWTKGPVEAQFHRDILSHHPSNKLDLPMPHWENLFALNYHFFTVCCFFKLPVQASCSSPDFCLLCLPIICSRRTARKYTH
jgi:hypothetical protein